MGGDLKSNLEMRCSADEAWYDGTLRFAPDSKDVIVVHFNDFGKEEDERFPTTDLLDPKKLKLRVRVRSEQLQDSECKLVKEDQLLCGCLDDGEDRKYYDAKVVSIVEKSHNDEECKCEFKLLWNDGPKKGKQTLVGCAEVCFLSTDNPEDDPMVKNLVKRLVGGGEQRRKLATPKRLLTKDLLSPKSRASSPTLDVTLSKKQAFKEPFSSSLAHPQLKKQSSREPSPSSLEPAPLKKQLSSKDHSPSTLPNQRVHLGQQASAKSQGSKKKRIMQAKIMEQPDLASDNDALDVNARPTSTSKDHSCKGSEDALGHGNESDDGGRSGGGGESVKKGSIGRRRLVKAKSLKAVVVPTSKVVPHEVEAPIRAVDKLMSPKEKVKTNAKKVTIEDNVACDKATAVSDIRQPVKKRLKSNPKKLTTSEVIARDEAPLVGEDDNVGQCPIKTRVKFNPLGKKGDPSVVAIVREDDVPRSYLNEEEKSSTVKKATLDVSTIHDKTVSLTLGERVKLKSLEKSKVVEASPLEKSKGTLEKKKPEGSPEKKAEVTLPKKLGVNLQKKPEDSPQKRKKVAHKVSLEKVGMQIVGKQMQKQVQLESHLRSNLDEVSRLDAPSSLKDVGVLASKEQQKRKPGRPRKRPISEPTAQSFASKKLTALGLNRGERQSSQQDEIIDAAIVNDEGRTPPSPCIQVINKRLGMKSLAESIYGIEEKFRSNHPQFQEPSLEKALDAHEVMTPGSSEELTGSPPRASNHVQETIHMSSLQKLEILATDVNASGKRRRRHMVLIDDEEDVVETLGKKSKNGKEHLHGSVDNFGDGEDNCNDPKTTSTSALDEEVVVQDGGKRATSRLLLISNMETNISAHDALLLLQEHTEGVCAVYVLPTGEFQTATVGYALYRDNEFALKAFEHLTAPTRFVVSPKGRPWIISQSTNVCEPHLCGFAIRTAYKSDDFGMCGIVSDQPPIQQLLMVTKERDSKAYVQALKRSEAYAEHEKWRKELYDRVFKDEMKGLKNLA